MARGKKAEKSLTPEEKLAQALVPAEEQPYPVPGNWCWTTLNHVANWGSGGTPSRKNPSYYEGTIPWIKTGELDDDYIFQTEEHISEEALAHSSAKIFPINTIVIAMYGATIGKVGIMGRNASTNQACACGVCSPAINYQYLFYYACSQKDSFILKAKGGAQPNISQEIIKNHSVPLPPLSEQQRIVDRIESLFAKLDEAKEKVQTVVGSFETRKSAILHKAFTGELTAKWRHSCGIGIDSWSKTSIGRISDVKGGKRIPKGMSLTTEVTGHPYIRAGNLKQGTVIDTGMMFVPDDVLKHIRNYIVHAGDVYITNVGACIGDCGIIPPKYDGANLTENAVKLTNLQCDSKFLAFYLASNTVQQKIKALIASATLGKLSIANIKTIEINLPSHNEQAEIVRIVDSLFAKEQQAKEAAEVVIEQIDTMKKSILARAFRGELGTNDPAEESAVKLLAQTE